MRGKNLGAVLAAVLAVVMLALASGASATQPEDTGVKVFVCKYVGQPGVDERLQTGQNPIDVSVNAIPDYQGVGSYFADGQGRSYVLGPEHAANEHVAEPDISACPAPEEPVEEPVLDCSGDEDPTNNGPNGDCTEPEPELDCSGDTDPTNNGPNGDCTNAVYDLCPNIDGIQETIPDGLVLTADLQCLSDEDAEPGPDAAPDEHVGTPTVVVSTSPDAAPNQPTIGTDAPVTH